jgi:hypothetical protein
MIVHAFVVYCLVFNPTMCREQEIVPDDYGPVTSVTHCAMGGMIYAAGGMIDRDGALWMIKGVRCKQEPLTDVQRRLRAAVTP